MCKTTTQKQKEQCITRTKLLLTNDEDTAKIEELNITLDRGKPEDFLYQSGIVLIALIKVLAIVMLGVFNSLVLYIPFIIIFLIVAYIHINHTGYWWAYMVAQRAINREHIKFATGQYKAIESDQTVETPKPLRRLPIRHMAHEIIENKDGGENSYIIKAKGILTDAEIIALITGQENANKIELFKMCRKLQFENYQVQPNL